MLFAFSFSIKVALGFITLGDRDPEVTLLERSSRLISCFAVREVNVISRTQPLNSAFGVGKV